MIKEPKSLFGRIAEFYFTPKFFERSGKIYEMLGIKICKKYIPSDGSRIRRLLKLPKVIKNEEDAIKYEKETRRLEIIHLVSLFIWLIAGFIFLLVGSIIEALLFLGILNLFINVYPIMLQRYNRARIYQMLENKKKIGGKIVKIDNALQAMQERTA